MEKFYVVGVGAVVIEEILGKQPFIEVKDKSDRLTLVEAAKNFITVPGLRKRVKLLLSGGRSVPISELSREEIKKIEAAFIEVAKKMECES